MSIIGSSFGNVPGASTVSESYETAITWASDYQLTWFNPGYISSSISDPTNSPTWRLRRGLVLGRITSSGQWTNYAATNTDGSEVAQGILAYDLRMQDVMSGSNVNKLVGILIKGNLQAGNLVGLDLMARAQLGEKFTFDDNLASRFFPWNRFQSKTADYTVVAADNFTLFDNVGAAGAVTFTLPALANGYFFGFRVQADQTVTVASVAGDDMVVFNDASADSVAFSTGGQKIGGMVVVYSNPGATKWIVENRSAGANTITVAT